MELGTWAEWAAALCGLAGAVVSIFALRTALAANATARQSGANAARFADETRHRERLRELSTVARQLQAWWVRWEDGAEAKYGVLVTNAGEGATVFRDVRIETLGNANVRGAKGHTAFTSLPPGAYVLTSTPLGSEQPWSDPEVARRDIAYKPLMKAQKYAVTCIRFEDPTKLAWTWTPERGLESGSAVAAQVG